MFTSDKRQHRGHRHFRWNTAQRGQSVLANLMSLNKFNIQKFVEEMWGVINVTSNKDTEGFWSNSNVQEPQACPRSSKISGGADGGDVTRLNLRTWQSCFSDSSALSVQRWHQSWRMICKRDSLLPKVTQKTARRKSNGFTNYTSINI